MLIRRLKREPIFHCWTLYDIFCYTLYGNFYSTSTWILIKIHTGHLLMKTLAHESSVMCTYNPKKNIN